MTAAMRDGGFWAWLGAAATSALGDSVTYFALGWSATAFGASAASLVMTVDSLPTVVLPLVGGVIADRLGLRKTMIGCDLAMAVIMTGCALISAHGLTLALLVAVAALSATTGSIRRPAGTVFPRLFATGEELQRRMAAVSGSQQVTGVVGPTLAGLLLGAGGLTLTSGLDAGSFALMAFVLKLVRPAQEPATSDQRESSGAWRSLVDGVVAARRRPGVPSMLLAVAALAGAVIPLVALGLPLAGRDRGWTATQTGLVSGAWLIGGLIVTGAVARWGAPRAATASLGPLLAAAGTGLLGLTRTVPLGLVGMLLVGVGTMSLTTYLFPAFAQSAPPEMLARFSALLQLAQAVPIAIVMPVMGALAAAAGVGMSLAVIAIFLGVAAAAAAVATRGITRTTQEPAAGEPTRR